MINERGIALRYLKSQKRRSLLMICGVVLAIALISAVFSMLNVIQEYEVAMQSANGVWHVQAQDCTARQAAELSRRLDVSASGQAAYVGNAVFSQNISGALTGCDENGFKQLNFKIQTGKVPAKDNEIALEAWAVKKIKSGARLGDTIEVQIKNQPTKSYILSAILKDNSKNRGSGYIRACVSLSEGKRLLKTDRAAVLMQVRNGINIEQFVKAIERDQHLEKSSVLEHGSLLAALGRSNSENVRYVYLVGGFLALLVLFSAIMMIYNSFNISVTQRIRQFGMLRAMGATPKQIRRVVRSESVFVSIFGVIPGLLLGVIATTLLIAFLRITMPEYFPPEGPVFYLSWLSLAIGAVTGVLATIFSSLSPARKAGRISPIEAMAASGGKSIQKKSSRGFLTRVIPVETALSIRRLTTRKRSFVLTSLSLSFGILLMLCFSPVMDMLREGASHNYDLGDLYITSEQESGFSQSLLQSLSKISGIQGISPQRVASVNATFPYRLLGGEYRDSIKDGRWLKAKESAGGMIAAPSKSSMIGLTDAQLNKFKSKLLFGTIDPGQLNRENGVILVLNYQGGLNNSDLRPGDSITVGSKALKICGVIKKDALMYLYQDSPFIGLYTTNRVFSTCSNLRPNLVTMTLKRGADSDAVYKQVKSLTENMKNVQVSNQHDAKSMADKINLVGDVFIYGFISVIALIGILNIINTMSTSVLVRTREIGLLRASGMTMGQITAMVASEAALYGIMSLAIGLTAGIPLQRLFFILTVKSIYAVPWSMPIQLIALSSALTFAAVMLSILPPLSHIKKIVITQAVTVE